MKEKYNPWEKLADIILKKLWDSPIKEVITKNINVQLTNNNFEKEELFAWLDIHKTRIDNSLISEREPNKKMELEYNRARIVDIEENINKALTEIQIKNMVSLAFIGLDEVKNEFYYIFYRSNIIPNSYIKQIRRKARMPYGYGSVGYSVRKGFEIDPSLEDKPNEADICLGDMRMDPRTSVNYTDFLLGNKSFISIPIYDKEGDILKFVCSIAIFLPVRNIWACTKHCLINSPQKSLLDNNICSLEILKNIIFDESTLLNIFSGTQYSTKYRFVDVIQKVFQDYTEITKKREDEKSWLNDVLDNIVIQNRVYEPYQDIIGAPFCILYEESSSGQFEYSNCTISHSHFIKDMTDIINMNMIINKNHHPSYHTLARLVDQNTSRFIKVEVKNNSLGYEWAVDILYNYFDKINDLILPIHNTHGNLIGIIKIVCTQSFNKIKQIIDSFIQSTEWDDFVNLFRYFEEIKSISDFEHGNEIIKDVYEISSVIYEIIPEYIFQESDDRRNLLKDLTKIVIPNLNRILIKYKSAQFNDVDKVKRTIQLFLSRIDDQLKNYKDSIVAISIWNSSEKLNAQSIYQISQYLFPKDNLSLKNEFFFCSNYSLIESFINKHIPLDTYSYQNDSLKEVFKFNISFPFENIHLYSKNHKLITIFHNTIDQEAFKEIEYEIENNNDIFNIHYNEILNGNHYSVIGWEKNYKDRLISLYFNMDLLRNKLEQYLKQHPFRIADEIFNGLFINNVANNSNEMCLEIIKKDFDNEFYNRSDFLNKSILIISENNKYTDISGFDFIKEIASYINIDFLNVIPIKTNGIKKILLLGHRASSRAGWINGISPENKKLNKIENDEEVATYLRLVLSLIENRLYRSFNPLDNDRRIQMLNYFQSFVDKFRTINTTTHNEIIDKFTDSYKKEIIFVSVAMKKILQDLPNYCNDKKMVLLTGDSGGGKGLLAELIADIFSKNNDLSPKFEIVDFKDITKENYQEKFVGRFVNETTSVIEGAFKKANNGVLFIDEYGRNSAEVNRIVTGYLEKFIINQPFSCKPVNGMALYNVDTKFIIATSVDLFDENVRIQLQIAPDSVSRFSDQYRIDLPSLKKRKDDIVLLLNHFIYLEMIEKNINEIIIPLNSSEYINSFLEMGSFDLGFRGLRGLAKSIVILKSEGKLDKSNFLERIGKFDY